MATAQIGSVGSWKQDADDITCCIYKPRASPKPRSISTSPRYVRTWSQEEDAYLLDARKSRVPYKDIAARLKKTDLACRLHYHQMVVARKNATAEANNMSMVAGQYEGSAQYSPRSESLPPISSSISQQSLLLPAPILRAPFRTGSGASILDSSHRRTISQPHVLDRVKYSQSSSVYGVQKHHDTTSQRSGSTVNVDRVQELYRDLAPEFWSNIAAAYSHGQPVSPSEVEIAFWQGRDVSRSERMFSNGHGSAMAPAIWQTSASMSVSTVSQESRTTSQAVSMRPHSAPSSRTGFSVNSLLNE